MMPIPASAASRRMSPLFDTMRLWTGTSTTSSSQATGQLWRSCSKAKFRQSCCARSAGLAGAPRRAR